MFIKKVFFILWILLCFQHVLWAIPKDGSAIHLGIHRFRPSIKALGMGDAYSTIVDGKTAPFYNPALLSFLPKESKLALNLVDLGLGYGAFVQYQDISKKLKIKNREEKIKELSDALADEVGNTFSLRVSSLGLYWYKKNYAVSFVPLDASLYFKTAQHFNVVLHLKGYADTLASISQSKMFESAWGKFSVGYTTKVIYRGYISHTLSLADLAFSDSLISNKEMSEGATLDMDMGIYYVPHKFKKGFFHFFHPSYSVVTKNTLDYGFFGDFNFWNKEANAYGVEKLYRVFDFGCKLQLQGMEYYQVSFTADIKM